MRTFVALLVVMILGWAPNAWAVWGGQEDFAHPSVGALYFDEDGDGAVTADSLICSGSYAGVSRDGTYDVFLTAGHCLPPADADIPAGTLLVSYDRDARDGVASPIRALAYHQMPGFGHDGGDRRDLGIVLLPRSSAGGRPAVQLPTAGYLDELKAAGDLKFAIVGIVGYGVVPSWDEAGPTVFTFDGLRRSGTSVITGLTKSSLRLNQNRHGIGTGSGLCFGDSGSPQFAEGTLLVLSVTSGGNGQCNANSINYRVDTPQARAFLGRFLALP